MPQGFVVDLQEIVRHNDLDRAVTFSDQRRQILLQCLLGRIGDDHVKRVVDHRALAGEPVILLQHPRQLHADMLGRKGDDRGGAAECSRGRRALKSVRIDDAGG